MVIVIINSWWPHSVAADVGKAYIEVMKKYPVDKSLYKPSIAACIRATKDGFKALAIDEVKEGLVLSEARLQGITPESMRKICDTITKLQENEAEYKSIISILKEEINQLRTERDKLLITTKNTPEISNSPNSTSEKGTTNVNISFSKPHTLHPLLKISSASFA